MTPADLPPLPEAPYNVAYQDAFTGDQMQAYAKLAVRQALERALSAVILRGRTDPSDVIRIIMDEQK